MPLASTGFFDVVLTVSAASFAQILDSRLLAALPPPGPTDNRYSVSLGPATLSFSNVSSTVFFTGSTAFDLTIELRNTRASIGTLQPDLGTTNMTIPCTITTVARTTPASDVRISIGFNGGAVTVRSPNAPAAVALQGAVRANFDAFLQTFGLTNPFFLGSPLPTVPAGSRAGLGATPRLVSLAVVAVPLPAGAPSSERALAFCLLLEDRAITGTRMPVNTAALPPFSGGPGADGTLEIDTLFLLELAHSALTAGPLSGVPFPPPTRLGGLTFAGLAPLTLGGVPGFLAFFSLTPPITPSTIPPVLTLTITFTFTLDSVTYTVTVAGATMTFGLAGSTLLVTTSVPAPTVTAAVPWWKVVRDVAVAVLLGGAFGPLAYVTHLVVSSVVMAMERAVVTGLAPSAATAAVGGVPSFATLPAGLSSLFGSIGLSPPLSFDDLRLPTTIGSLALAGTYRRVDAVSLSSIGEVIDLDTGVRGAAGAALGIPPGLEDLAWSLAYGLRPGTNARLARINRDFNATAVTDVADALAAGSSIGLAPSQIPTVPAGTTALPPPAVIAVRTNTGRYAKCAVWMDTQGGLVLRFLVWETRAAACRILPVTTSWTVTDYVRDPDTPSNIVGVSTKHERFAHGASFEVQTGRLTPPVQPTWTLAGTPIAGTGTVTVEGATVTYDVQLLRVEIGVGLGQSLSSVPLTVEVRDANGLFVTDSRLLAVAGTNDETYSAFPSLDRVFIEAFRRFQLDRLRGRPVLEEPPGDRSDQPRDPRVAMRGPDELLQERLKLGGLSGTVSDFHLQ